MVKVPLKIRTATKKMVARNMSCTPLVVDTKKPDEREQAGSWFVNRGSCYTVQGVQPLRLTLPFLDMMALATRAAA